MVRKAASPEAALRFGEKTTSLFAPNPLQKFDGVLGVAKISARRAGVVGRWPLKEIVITCRSAFGDFALHCRLCDVVGGQNLRELRDADADESGVAHHIENIRERHARKVVPRFEPSAQRTLRLAGSLPAACASGRASAQSAARSVASSHSGTIIARTALVWCQPIRVTFV